MNIKLNYNLGDGKVSPQQFTYSCISYAIGQKYKDGLEGQMRRIWGRIQTKFEDAIEKDENTIELETTEKEMIVKAYNETKFPPSDAKNLNVLDVEMDNLLKEDNG